MRWAMPMPISRGSILASRSEASGWAYPPETSKRLPASLNWGAGGVSLRVEGGARPDQIAEIATLPKAPARVTLFSGWVFETEDPLDGLAPDGWLTRLEGWHPRLALVALSVLVAGYALWRWGFDLLASVMIALTPAPLVSNLDLAQMALIDETLSATSALPPARQAELTEIFARVSAAAPPPPFGPYRLEFRALEGMGPNAFALPDGTVVLTDDLANRFASDDVIAGVLGHEIAHTARAHALHQLYRAGASYLIVALVVGDAGPILNDMVLEGNALLSLKYSRSHEAEADALGTQIAAKAGYDPRALAAFFEALEAEFGEQGPQWLSTHPDFSARIKAIRQTP